MALREKFGRLVLLEETDASPLGREYRAARLGPAGLDRLVSVLRFTPAVSQDAAATKRLMDEARLAARLSNPGLQRVLGIGRVDQSFYVSTELVEGRTLAAVIERCARESFPFAADHALMVASRAASALEYLHGKKDEAGATLFHGLLAPRHLVVAFDGEVKLKGLGLWPSLHGGALLPAEERAYLAPEQAEGGPGDARSDVYSLGRILLSSITLCPPDGRDPLAALAEARVTAPTGETGPVPKPLDDLLRRALAADAAARHPSIADMRKAIDTLLFSGDFTPTTFDLAFFMHTLFREDMEAEARTLEEERKADYREFLAEEKPAVPATPASDPAVRPAATEPDLAAPAVLAPTLVESARTTVEQRPPTTPMADAAAEAVPTRESSGRAREASAREAAARMSLGTAAPEKRGPGLWIGAAAAVLALAAAGGWLLMSRAGRSPASDATPAAPSPEAQAAMARVKELESRITQLETEKAAAETKAAEDARKKLEAQAAAKGRAVDPQALERAQEEARQRARAEQEARQQEELRRIAEARRDEERRIAEASPPPTPAPAAAAPAAPPAAPGGVAAPTPTPTPPAGGAAATPSAEATPAIVTATPGVVTPTPASAAPDSAPAAAPEVKLVPPAVVGATPATYPPLAKERKIEGVVEVSALVDETGRVAEANIVRASPKRMGFEDAALAHVRSRRYRPATRDGVPVRVWVSIIVEFKPKR